MPFPGVPVFFPLDVVSGILNLRQFLISALSRLLGGEQQFNWLFIVVNVILWCACFFLIRCCEVDIEFDSVSDQSPFAFTCRWGISSL